MFEIIEQFFLILIPSFSTGEQPVIQCEGVDQMEDFPSHLCQQGIESFYLQQIGLLCSLEIVLLLQSFGFLVDLLGDGIF